MALVVTTFGREEATHVRIQAQGVIRQGRILSANNFVNSVEAKANISNWYIELEDDKTGYAYYKEIYDKGTITWLKEDNG
jgi:hypothetical protein